MLMMTLMILPPIKIRFALMLITAPALLCY